MSTCSRGESTAVHQITRFGLPPSMTASALPKCRAAALVLRAAAMRCERSVACDLVFLWRSSLAFDRARAEHRGVCSTLPLWSSLREP